MAEWFVWGCFEFFFFFSITQFSDFWVMSYGNWKHILGMKIELWWHFCKYTLIEGPIVRPFALSNTRYLRFFFFFLSFTLGLGHTFLSLFFFFFFFHIGFLGLVAFFFFSIPFHWVSVLHMGLESISNGESFRRENLRSMQLRSIWKVLWWRRWMTGLVDGLWVGLLVTTVHWVARSLKSVSVIVWEIRDGSCYF